MPITSVTRWKIDPEQASRIIRDATRNMKEQGASQVRLGRIHAGQYAGQTLAIVTYENFETYGRAMMKQQQDQKFQQQLQEAMKVGELLERTLITMEEIQ